MVRFPDKFEQLTRAVCRRLGYDENRWRDFYNIVEEEVIRVETRNLLSDLATVPVLNEEGETDK